MKTITITDPDDIRPGDVVTVRVTDVGSQTDNGHMDYTVLSATREVPEWKPSTVGTALVTNVEGRQVVFRVAREGEAFWIMSNGDCPEDQDVSDFVPDDVEALRPQVEDKRRRLAKALLDAGRLERERDEARTEAKDLGIAFDDLTERWRVQNADLAKLRKDLEAEQRGRNALAAGLEAERDRALAEVNRMTLAAGAAAQEVTELRAQADILVDKLGAEQSRAERAEAEVERLRAARPLPTREQVKTLLRNYSTPVSRTPGMYADGGLALFEQGGAAATVTREQVEAITGAMYGPPIYMSRDEFIAALRNALAHAGIEVAE